MTETQRGPDTGQAAEPDEHWQRAVVQAVHGLRFGSVEIVVHEGRVVQVETREKVRFDGAGRLPTRLRGAALRNTSAGPTATRGGPAPLPEDTSE
jgi:hypothetical protein